MLGQVIQSYENLISQAARHNQEDMRRVFVRSDTNIEDLEGFNGAGLNESVGDVAFHHSGHEEIAAAIKHVWKSPFKEKSITWRAAALDATEVPIAEPSVIIMPLIDAKSSGVIISRGGEDWVKGKGVINADFRWGQVVESRQPVEEITLENGSTLRYSFAVSDYRSRTRGVDGDLPPMPIEEPGQKVLSREEALHLNQVAVKIDEVLGEQPFGWDIEYAFDFEGRLWILQARPN